MKAKPINKPKKPNSLVLGSFAGASNDKTRWYEYPLRIVETCDILNMSGMKEKLWGEKEPWIKEAETKAQYFLANVEHLHVQACDGGADDRGFLFRTQAAKQGNIDYLGKYLPEAKKKGLRTFVYFNVHWMKAHFGKEHPDWIQYDNEGKAITPGYGSGALFCVNTPWRQWSFQIIRDLACYEIDGIFLDGPFVSHKGCYCSYCAERFKDKYNSPFPEKAARTSPEWRKFMEFRYESIAGYLKDARETLRSLRPEAIMYMNSNHLLPGWTTARDNRRLVKHQDILAAEGGFIFYTRPIDIPLWKPGATAKLLETQSDGKPRVVFLCGNHKPWDRYLLPEAEIRLLYAETIANGASPWFALFPEGFHLKGAEACREMNGFIADNSEYYESTTSLAQVALVWSQATEDYYGSAVDYTDFSSEQNHAGQIANSKECFQGYYETLVRAHIPFDVIDDVSLEDGSLKRYKAVVLPGIACISENGIRGIKKYVEDGGGLIATLESSLYTHYGERLANFQLAEVLGITYAQGHMGPLPYDYISITQVHQITKDMPQKLFPAPTYGVKTVLQGANSLMAFHEQLPARYVTLPPISQYTAMALNTFGKGRTIYLGGNFAGHYWSYRIPEHKQLLENAVRWLSKPQIQLENAPETLEVIVREQKEKNRLLVHLINFTGEMSRPITRIIPIRRVKIRIDNTADVRSVMALRRKNKIAFTKANKCITFCVDQIREYEVLVIE